MLWLGDTGVLIRYVQPRDPDYQVVRQAVSQIRHGGDEIAVTWQNIAEFWNVCTRPSSARGGYGLSVTQTVARVKLLERAFTRLEDLAAGYSTWLSLIESQRVLGVQVHDARLAAAMLANGVTHILTFNTSDFARYPGITAVHPQHF